MTKESDGAKNNGRLEPGGNLSPETIAYLDRRSAAFQRALNRKGMPMTFGHGKRKKDEE